MTPELASELFEYRDGRLYHKVTRRRLKAGTPAGALNGTGYRQMGVNGKYYREHALVFLMHHGYIPPEIDHINGDRADNRIENLRAVTRSQNQYNKAKCRNNTSGHRGVSWHNTSKAWLVRISVEGKNRIVGYFKDLDAAAKASQNARLEHYGTFSFDARQSVGAAIP
jgi:hypothetical protein